MGGRFWRVLRNDASDAFALGDRGIKETREARVREDVEGGGMSADSLDSFVLSDATRLKVVAGSAVICRGGRGAGFGIFGSVAESVCGCTALINAQTRMVVASHTYLAAFPTHEQRDATFASVFVLLLELGWRFSVLHLQLGLSFLGAVLLRVTLVSLFDDVRLSLVRG
jgi:hypothetical protein